MLTRTQNFVAAPSPADSSKMAALLLFCLLLCLLVPAAAGSAESPETIANYIPPSQDGQGFEGVVDPALAWFNSQEWAVGHSDVNRSEEEDLDKPVTLDHVIPLEDGRHLFVQETFTTRSWLRQPSRAVLFFSGSVFRGNHWRIPVDGYNGPELAARRGYFAYTVDYLGVGNSSSPETGWEITRDANRDAMKVLLRYIRYFRNVPRVDLVGEGYGGSIATELGADPTRVRSVSGSAMIYTVTAGGPLTDPTFVEMLRNSPTGYFFIPGAAGLAFMGQAPEPAREFVEATQGGLYPVLNFLGGATLPNLDPSVARVPGLIIHGALDFIAPDYDIRQLAADYGEYGARYVSRADAGHAPRSESPEVAAWFWQTLFGFLENPDCFYRPSSSTSFSGFPSGENPFANTPCAGSKIE